MFNTFPPVSVQARLTHRSVGVGFERETGVKEIKQSSHHKGVTGFHGSTMNYQEEATWLTLYYFHHKIRGKKHNFFISF